MTRRATASGFTAIELMIVLAVVALLLTLAAPSYFGVQLRVHRAAAIGSLMSAASCQERTLAARGRYDTTRCIPPASPRYRFAFVPADTVDARQFRVTAEPRGRQASDRCGSLSLDSMGRRAVGETSADLGACWAGR